MPRWPAGRSTWSPSWSRSSCSGAARRPCWRTCTSCLCRTEGWAMCRGTRRWRWRWPPWPARSLAGWAAGSLVLLMFGAPSGQPSLERVHRALHVYGCDPADLEPLPGQDRRSARYLVSSHSRPDLFVKVVSRERRDSDLLYRGWCWLRHRGRPPGRLGDAVAQVEHEALMGLLAAAGGVQAPPVLLVGSFGNGAGLLVQQRVAGRDLTELGDGRLDDAMLADVWRQVAGCGQPGSPTATWGWPASCWTSRARPGWSTSTTPRQQPATRCWTVTLARCWRRLAGWPTRHGCASPPSRPSARSYLSGADGQLINATRAHPHDPGTRAGLCRGPATRAQHAAVQRLRRWPVCAAAG